MIQAFQGAFSIPSLTFSVLFALLATLSLALLVLSSYLKAILDRLPSRPQYNIGRVATWVAKSGESLSREDQENRRAA